MDWAAFWTRLNEAWSGASAQIAGAWSSAQPQLQSVAAFLANPWARAIGLCVIVYLTIRIIASVYSGDRQNSELGPIGIRPHTAKRLDRKTIVLPRQLMPMNMDGVAADVKIYYAYTDARGKPCKQLVHTLSQGRLAVSPAKLTKVANTIFGHEVPDVATNDVCFPAIEMEAPPAEMPPTPDRAIDYAKQHNIVENWREDDEALLVSLHAELQEEVADAREQFIVTEARKVAAAREGNVLHRLMNRDAARKRPNVVGSYYLKFEFSHDPMFVLTRHPDRELKMTAWLTVLTSMFALVMDAWPREAPRAPVVERPAHAERAPSRAPHVANP